MNCCASRAVPGRAPPPRATLFPAAVGTVGARLACFLLALCASAAWSQAPRNFPATALRGEVHFAAPPAVELNGEPARLAPGARIHGEDRMLRLPAALAGQTLTVHYTREATTGLLREVWVLSRAERAREPWPATEEEARTWRFDPAAQTWSRK